MAASTKMTVFWDVAPCSLVVYRRFRCACCRHHQADIASETSVNFYQTPRRNIPEDHNFQDILFSPQNNNINVDLSMTKRELLQTVKQNNPQHVSIVDMIYCTATVSLSL
jgi:hypothetical protein